MRAIFEFLKRPAVTFWISIAVLAGYPLSIGPAFYVIWNVRLPEIVVDGFWYFYCPVASVAQKSEVFGPVMESYVLLWLDFDREPVNNVTKNWPEPPPFFIEAFGAFAGAWIVWTFVRWLNRRHRTAANVAPWD